MKRIIIALVFPLITFNLHSQEKKESVLGKLSSDTGLIINDSITNLLIHHSSGDRAYNYVQQISLWDRQHRTKEYNVAVNWIKQKAIEFGLQDVKVEKYLSDGKTSYFGNTSSPFWIAKKGELWSVKPYKYKITSYDDLPMSLAGNSYSIKANAQLVDIGSGTNKDYDSKDLKGKIVLTSSYPSSVARRAVWEKGAIGVISYYSVPYWDKSNRLEGDFIDQVGWGGMPIVQDKNRESFAFMISERKAKELKEQLRRNSNLMLYVDVETEHKPDEFGIVSGVIKGSKYPDEEIIITSHIDHYKPGANDNASGSAVSLEIIRTLNTLIEQNKISRPLRTLRFLWLPEFTGTKAWFSRHLKENKKRILNINLDMLGGNLKKADSYFYTTYTPDWNASYINAFSSSIVDFLNQYNNSKYPRRKDFHIISVNGSRNYANASLKPYTRGSDHQIFNDFGIPGISYSTWPDNYYHSSEDSPDKVDPTQLHRVAFTSLASLVMTSYADEKNVFDIIDLVEMYGQKRLKTDEFEARKMILSTASSDLKNQFYFSSKIIQYGYEREIKALESCLLFSDEKKVKKIIQKKTEAYKERKRIVLKELQDLANRTNSKSSLKTPEITPVEDKARKIIPARRKGKELNSYYSAYQFLKGEDLQKYQEVNQGVEKVLTTLREREVGELRIYQFQDVIASYCDGKRSVLDIRNALYAEYKVELPIKLVLNLFEVLERGKIVDLTSN